MVSSRRCLLAVAVASVLATVPLSARGDSVTLASGGELRGEVLKPETPDQVVVRTLSGAQIVVAKADVQSILKRRLALEEFETRRRITPDTVEAQLELAEWCKEKSLRPEREKCLKRVIDLEPDHKFAHQQLGHVFHEGEWTTHDEIMRNRGYVKYKGRYVLPQELEIVLQQERESEAEKGWYRRVNLWHDWIDGNRPDRAAEGFRSLMAITDGNAVPALYKAFCGDPVEDQRRMYVSILAQIGGNKVVGPLVLQSLRDESEAVRLLAVKAIPEEQYGEAMPVYLRALRNELNVIVNRAGAALGIIGDESAVPALIDALVTRHKYKFWVPDQNITVGVNSQGQIGTPNYSPVANLPPDVAVMALTGQLPYGYQVNYANAPEPRKKLTVVQKDEQNPLVHAALQKLTGENYNYDEKTWKKWWNGTRGGLHVKP